MAEKDLSINKRVIMCRRERFLTQSQVAEMLGTKSSTYAQMEREGNITAECVKKLAAVLGVEVTFLLYGGEKPKNDCILKDRKRYDFLEMVSSTELKLMKDILFHLPRKKRTCVYNYALDILNEKKSSIH